MTIIPAEILLARLAPGTAKTDPNPGGTAATDIDVAMIDSALAKINEPLSRLILRVKWAGQENQRGTLEHALVPWFSRGFPWIKPRKPQIIPRLVRAAVEEIVNEANCSGCGGHGLAWGVVGYDARRRFDKEAAEWLYENAPMEGGLVCPRCRGKKRLKMTHRLLAEKLELDQAAVSRKWWMEFNGVLVFLTGFEISGLQALERSIYGQDIR